MILIFTLEAEEQQDSQWLPPVAELKGYVEFIDIIL